MPIRVSPARSRAGFRRCMPTARRARSRAQQPVDCDRAPLPPSHGAPAMIPLKLEPDRLFSPEPGQRALARALYATVKDLPIVSPHGHTDPQWFANNEAFTNASALFITPDHYVFRMLYSQGVRLEDLAIPRRDGGEVEGDPRKIWRIFAGHY